MLEVFRVKSCLQLCRRRRGEYDLELWANLKFSTIERMCNPLILKASLMD